MKEAPTTETSAIGMADPAPEAGLVLPDAPAAARRTPSAIGAGWAISAALLAFSVCMSVLPPALVRIQPELALDTASVGRLSAFMFGPFLVTIAAASYLLRHHQKGALTTEGCVLMLAGCIACALSNTLTHLCIGAALLGVGGGLIELSSSALIGELFTGHRRTTAMNYSHVAFAAGAIGTPMSMAVIIRSGLDWRLGFWGAAFVTVLGGSWMMLSGTHRMGPPPEGADRVRATMDRFCAVLAGAMLFYAAAEVAVCYWLPTYFIMVLNSSEAFAAAANGVFWSGMIVGRLAAGSLGRKYSDADVLRVCSMLATASAGLFLVLRSPLPGVAAAGLTGLTFAAIWPTIVSYAGHVYASRLTFAYPIVIGAGAVGATVGPVALGALAAPFGHHIAFVMVPVSCAAIAALMIAAPGLERWAKPLEETRNA